MSKQKKVELTLSPPLYSTYHNQGSIAGALADNPSIRNWYLNKVLMLSCTRRFLQGRTTPELGIVDSGIYANPYVDRKWYSMEHLGGHIGYAIRNLIDEGYCVFFVGIDDYYVEGKSWYHERHFNHDGCICGYDQENKSFCLYSYGKDWVYQKFWVSQKSFDNGRKAMAKKGTFGSICGVRAKKDNVLFSASEALTSISEYLDSTMDKYPETEEGTVLGIVVLDYLALYIKKLIDGIIPHDKIDRRIFRLIWEHKKVMLERIQCVEQQLGMDSRLSNEYMPVVSEANTMRMLYASHVLKRRDSLLPTIRNKLVSLKESEQKILCNLIDETKGRTVNETMDVH